jgi:hypothetical protein
MIAETATYPSGAVLLVALLALGSEVQAQGLALAREVTLTQADHDQMAIELACEALNNQFHLEAVLWDTAWRVA